MGRRLERLMVWFTNLWNNYPSSDPCIDPTTGERPKGYDNQCALRLSHALARSGVDFRTFRGAGCPTGREGGIAASAQALADWLQRRPFSACPSAESYTGQDVFNRIKDRSGIVFLADYWVRPNGRRTGDHIDLWNGWRFTSYWSAPRVHLGISWDGRWSDYRRAKSALFWALS